MVPCRGDLRLAVLGLAPEDNAVRGFNEYVAARGRVAAARWNERGVEPAAAADDAELLCRPHLDLAGVIPTVWEARAYLAGRSPAEAPN